jgi:hypothetical protein
VDSVVYGDQAQADRYVPIPDPYADKDKSGLTCQATGGNQNHTIELN